MPRIGIRCPVDDADLPDDHCLACKRADCARVAPRSCPWPYEMLSAMLDRRGRESAHISATMISSLCLRKVYLEREVDYTVSPIHLYPAVRGKIAHAMTERWPEPGAVYEVRFETVIALPTGNHVTFTGQIDKLMIDSGIIIDFKTKDKVLPRAPQPEHVFQLNCYRYLVQHGWPQKEIRHDAYGSPLGPFCPGTPAGITINELRLVYWHLPTGRTAIFSVPLLDVDTEITSRLAHLTGPALPDVPPHLDPYRSTFCCEWCPVVEQCRQQSNHSGHL